MNINALTTNFMGTKPTRGEINRSNATRPITRQTTNRSCAPKAQYDTYTRQLTQEEIAERKKQTAVKRQQEKTKNQILGASKLAAAMAAFQVIRMLTANPATMLDGQGNTLQEAAEYMDVPVEIVEIVNNAKEDDILDEYIVPEKYNGIDNAIEECEEKLLNKKLSEEKREELEAELEDLKNRKEKLDEMGEVYIDPKSGMTYIKLNGVCGAEYVKKVLGITKDGEFRDDTKYDWGYNDIVDKYYKDYTNSVLKGVVDCRTNTLNPKHE